MQRRITSYEREPKSYEEAFRRRMEKLLAPLKAQHQAKKCEAGVEYHRRRANGE